MEAESQTKASRGRVWIFLFSLAAIILLVLVAVVVWNLSAERAPRFVSLESSPTNGHKFEYYNFLDKEFARDGKVWIWVSNGSKSRQYLYDLQKRAAIGEVLNGAAISFNGDNSQLLCGEAARNPSLSGRLLEQLNVLVAKLRHHQAPKSAFRYENLWLLNLKSNTAVQVGTLQQSMGGGSSWHPSPDHRLAYNRTTAHMNMFWVFDFDTGQMREMPCKQQPYGWWDNQNVLMCDYSDVTLYNVLTGATTNLVSADAIDAFTKTNELTGATKCTVMANWHGHQYDFYLVPSQPYAMNKAFLAKIQRSEPRLKLIAREFEHRWSGSLNSDETLYLYPGETGRWGRGGDGSVMLRDLRDNSVRALVPGGIKRYTLCRFIDGGVIYSTNDHLWRIDLNGSNNVPLFGPSN